MLPKTLSAKTNFINISCNISFSGTKFDASRFGGLNLKMKHKD